MHDLSIMILSLRSTFPVAWDETYMRPCLGASLGAPEMHCLPSKQLHVVPWVCLLQFEAQAMHL